MRFFTIGKNELSFESDYFVGSSQNRPLADNQLIYQSVDHPARATIPVFNPMTGDHCATIVMDQMTEYKEIRKNHLSIIISAMQIIGLGDTWPFLFLIHLRFIQQLVCFEGALQKLFANLQ